MAALRTRSATEADVPVVEKALHGRAKVGELAVEAVPGDSVVGAAGPQEVLARASIQAVCRRWRLLPVGEADQPLTRRRPARSRASRTASSDASSSGITRLASTSAAQGVEDVGLPRPSADASAAPRFQPPAKTASRANRACSTGRSRSWLQSMVARSVRWRGGRSTGRRRARPTARRGGPGAHGAGAPGRGRPRVRSPGGVRPDAGRSPPRRRRRPPRRRRSGGLPSRAP